MARKTGSSGKMKNGLTIAENDSGIVTLGSGKHYAIAVFVKDSMESEEVNCGMIAQISKVVWDALNKNKINPHKNRKVCKFFNKNKNYEQEYCSNWCGNYG